MLTSHHSLLSGFAAVICATSVVYQSAPQNMTESLVGPPVPTSKTVDVSYRGSGRVESDPVETEQTEANSSRVAHRGSGRVLTLPL